MAKFMREATLETKQQELRFGKTFPLDGIIHQIDRQIQAHQATDELTQLIFKLRV